MAAAVAAQPAAPSQNAPQITQRARECPVPRHDVKTVLNYFKENEDGSPPHPTYIDRPETYPRLFEPHQVVVKDIAGEEDRYSLDKNGFQIYGHVASEKAFLDDDNIKAGYYAETERLLKDATGASKVFIFDHTVRRQPPGLSPEQVLLIKCFDSKKDGRARRVPHTAFEDTGARKDAPPRESIEVRALVFHEDDDDD